MGTTVSAIGPHKGLQHVRKIVEQTMKNIHPVYNIKALMIKRELAKDPKLKNENWERFLPKYKAKNLPKRKAPKNINKKSGKEYTPFPPPQPESKIDMQLASGEYFLKENEKREKRMKDKLAKRAEAETQRQQRRNAAFVSPEEEPHKAEANDNKSEDIDIQKLKQKVNASKKKGFKTTQIIDKQSSHKSKAKNVNK